jgi:hypothetical protein
MGTCPYAARSTHISHTHLAHTSRFELGSPRVSPGGCPPRPATGTVTAVLLLWQLGELSAPLAIAIAAVALAVTVTVTVTNLPILYHRCLPPASLMPPTPPTLSLPPPPSPGPRRSAVAVAVAGAGAPSSTSPVPRAAPHPRCMCVRWVLGWMGSRQGSLLKGWEGPGVAGRA